MLPGSLLDYFRGATHRLCSGHNSTGDAHTQGTLINVHYTHFIYLLLLASVVTEKAGKRSNPNHREHGEVSKSAYILEHKGTSVIILHVALETNIYFVCQRS